MNSTGPPDGDIKREISTAAEVGFVLMYALLTVGTIFGNLLVIRAFIKFTNLRTASNSILVSLSVVDLLMIIVFILNILTALSAEPRQTLCTMRSMLNLLFDFIIILHLALISVDRFIAVKFALRYRTIVSNRRAVIAIIVVWVWAILISHAFPETLKIDGAKTFHQFFLSLAPCIARLKREKQPFNRSHSIKAYLCFLVLAPLVVPLAIVTISYS